MRAAVALLLAAALLPAPTALCQTRLGFEIQGGAVLPLSAYAHNIVRTDVGEVSDTLGDDVVSRLVDQYTRLGFQVGVGFLINQIEIRYAFHRLGWDREETRCAGRGSVVGLPTGEIDDSTVVYDCSIADVTSDISSEGPEPLILHVISFGYRIPFLSVPESLEAYAAPGLGLGINNYSESLIDTVYLGLALGADIAVVPEVTLPIEVRYSLFLTGPTSRFQSASNRAVARGENALEATIEAFHAFTFGAGVRLNFL